MVRVQLQLTDEQAQALKRLASERGVSVAELIRSSVERLLADDERRHRRERALGVAGKFAGPADLSRNHDQYFVPDAS